MHLAHPVALDLAVEDALDREGLVRRPEVAVELAHPRRCLALFSAGGAALGLAVAALAPLAHLAHHAVAVAARVAVGEVVGGRAVRVEEQLLQYGAVGGAAGLRDRESGPPRRLERLELVLRRDGARRGSERSGRGAARGGAVRGGAGLLATTLSLSPPHPFMT